jgi:hypothetical protein
MGKYLIYLLLFFGCTNSQNFQEDTNSRVDISTAKTSESPRHAMALRSALNTADSIILAGHYSPNEPIKDERTGKYLPSFEVIVNGKLNESIVQERKKLDRKEIKELGDILFSPTVADSIAAICFQPRNGIFIYNSGKLSYIDVCFDCHGFAISRDLESSVIFDNTKYERLLQFYRKQGFKYML